MPPFPGLKGGRGQGKRSKLGRKFGYTPTLSALLGGKSVKGLTTKQKKQTFTGFEVRPFIEDKKSKKRVKKLLGGFFG